MPPVPPSPPTVDPKVIREEMALSVTDQGFVTACGNFLTTYSKGDPALIAKMSDPQTDADKADPTVMAYANFQAALLRAKRQAVAWDEAVYGNTAYIPDPVSFEKGGDGPQLGPGNIAPKPPSADDLLTALQNLAVSNPQSLMTALQNPKYAAMVSGLKAYLCGGGPTVTTPAPGGPTAPP